MHIMISNACTFFKFKEKGIKSSFTLSMVCMLQIRSSVGENLSYEVTSQGVKDQVLEVLNAFNVYVSQQDIFSRCQV